MSSSSSSSSSSLWACTRLERSHVHKLPPPSLVLSKSPRWVDSPRWSGWKSTSRVRSRVWRGGRAGRSLQTSGSLQIDIFRALNMSCKSPCLPHDAPKNRGILFGWATAAAVESRLGVVLQHSKHGLCTESEKYVVRNRCCDSIFQGLCQ